MKASSIKKSTIIEAALLKAMSLRPNFDNYNDFIVKERLLEETKILLECYTKYYELYSDHKYINFDIFLTQFCAHWHSQDMDNDTIDWYKEIIIRIESSDPVDAETALIGLVNKQFISKINQIGEKEFNSDHIRDALEEYEKNYSGIVKEYDDDAFHIDDIDLSMVDKSLGLPYCFDEIQRALGGMINGSLIAYNAANGQGKTALAVKQAAHSIKYLKKAGIKQPVLWLNTEGTRDVVFTRVLSNMYREHLTHGYRDLLDANMLNKIQKHFKKVYGNDALKIFTANGCGINYIRMKIKKYQPALVILDMAAHMATSTNKNASDVNTLVAFFNALRRLSTENCPIIATVQAGNGAKWWNKDEQKYMYKQWPTDDDMYGSKDGIQASCETIITMGRDNDHKYTRYIQTTKVKAEDTAKFVCELNPKYNDFDPVTNLRSKTNE